MKNNFTLRQCCLAMIVLLSVCAFSCGKKDDASYIDLRVNNLQLDPNGNSIYISLESNSDWEVRCDANWAVISPVQGDGDKNLLLTYEANNSGAERVLKVYAVCDPDGNKIGKYGKAESRLELVQASLPNSNPLPDPEPKPRKGPKWMELPAFDSNDPKWHSHRMEYDGKTVRNFSYYFDDENYIAYWVAYPLCKAYTVQNTKRTNAWGYDPGVPADKQANLYRAFKPHNAYDRGHQIPSADRLFSRDANVSTFYYTNMTPQLPEFNQKLWAELEGCVRSWSDKSDTLYVVTGCTTDTRDGKYAYDNDNKKVKVPSGYYKALLRYNKENSLDHYMAVAFYYTHDDHTGRHVNKNGCMSVSELEKMTGISFFVNLDDKVGRSRAKAIKNENPREEDWWWKNKDK